MTSRTRPVATLAALISLLSSACSADLATDRAVSVAREPLVQTLLEENFEAGLGAVSTTGDCSTGASAALEGARGLRCMDTASAELTISTAGASQITLSYARATARYDAGERFFAELSVDGGTTWQVLEEIGGTTPLASVSFALGAEADDTTLRLRFRSNANGFYEWFDLDAIRVDGDVDEGGGDDGDCDGVDDDGDGQIDEDQSCEAEQVLFFDSFENLSRWTETGGGDWNVEPLHSSAGYPAGASGPPAAHADSCGTGCQLTLTEAIDLSEASSATLQLLRFVDSTLDAGEFLSVELFDGSAWTTELHFTQGAGADNVWHAESIDLSDYLGTPSFRIRLATRSSSFIEHVHVDDVRVTAVLGGDPGDPGDDFTVSTENLRAHVEFLTQSTRERGSAHLAASLDYCEQQLQGMGYEIERQNFSFEGFTGQNVIGTLPGGALAEQTVIVSAHVDHVPACLGADDNASGVAGAIETARLLAQSPHPRTAVVACWDLEETNLGGSRAYAQRAAASGQDIRVSFVYESIGYTSDAPNSQQLPGGDSLFSLAFPAQYAQLQQNQFRGDFLGIATDRAGTFTQAGGEPFALDIVQAASAVGLDTISVDFSSFLIGVFTDVLRSDHAAFWEQGYSAVLITNTAELRNPFYHCGAGQDAIDTLDFDFMQKVAQATSVAVRQALDE